MPHRCPPAQSAVLPFLLVSLSLSVPARGQFPLPNDNAVIRIGIPATVGAGAGLLVALGVAIDRAAESDPAEETPWSTARWVFVGGTLGGAAIGAVLAVTVPYERVGWESKAWTVGKSAIFGWMGGTWIGMASGLLLEPDLEDDTVGIATAVGSITGLAVGIWAGIHQASAGPRFGAAVTLAPSSSPGLALPVLRPLPSVEGRPRLAVELLAIRF